MIESNVAQSKGVELKMEFGSSWVFCRVFVSCFLAFIYFKIC